MNERISALYSLWQEKAVADEDVAHELQEMAGNGLKIEDAFYKDLSFGTGGLRGLIGAGTNRMNIYTVARASQGLANYVKSRFPEKARTIAVGYDSRIKSELFAKTASGIFAANHIQVYIYPQLMPTPCLSFAVRALGCAAGVMITASHNPAQYNGYKVYGSDGCQITTAAAEEILAEIEKLDMFSDEKTMPFQDGLKSSMIHYISEDIYTSFTESVKSLSVLGDAPADYNISVVYTPLNGTGLLPVLRVLQESGYKNVTVVREQEQPNGHFPTCPYPNPEIEEAMSLGLDYAKRLGADLLLATDPDCDRVGIAVRDRKSGLVLLTGNETGLLLLDYICSRRAATGTTPDAPVAIKTIVTTDMAERIAAAYGVQVRNVLTGFKYIGEQIGIMEEQGQASRYIFGFEESCGYLSGTHVRDKDGVNAALLICEMAAYNKAQGICLKKRLDDLYKRYGYSLNILRSYEFEGVSGDEKMKLLMCRLRDDMPRFGEWKVERCLDYAEGVEGLPKANVLKFFLAGGGNVVIRPSGTEPKIKVYISVTAGNREEAKKIAEEIADGFEEYAGLRR